MRVLLAVLAVFALLGLLAAPSATQPAETDLVVTVTPATGTADTMFVLSGEGCTSGSLNWEVHSAGGEVLLFGTAQTMVDGAWTSPEILGDLGGAGPGEYLATADCLQVGAYTPATFTVTSDTGSRTTTETPPPRMTG